MKSAVLFFSLFMSSFVLADTLTGKFYIHETTEQYKKENGEIRGINFQVKGRGAMKIYNSIKSPSYFDECEGVTKKRLKNFICQIDEKEKHMCYFSLNIQTQSLNDLEC
jgi:hypothetical protein